MGDGFPGEAQGAGREGVVEVVADVRWRESGVSVFVPFLLSCPSVKDVLIRGSFLTLEVFRLKRCAVAENAACCCCWSTLFLQICATGMLQARVVRIEDDRDGENMRRSAMEGAFVLDILRREIRFGNGNRRRLRQTVDDISVAFAMGCRTMKERVLLTAMEFSMAEMYVFDCRRLSRDLEIEMLSALGVVLSPTRHPRSSAPKCATGYEGLVRRAAPITTTFIINQNTSSDDYSEDTPQTMKVDGIFIESLSSSLTS
jgi:hypothetical protein